jgi:hypothetical protein
MTRYVFSEGKIHALEGIVLRPEKRHHPLRTATMFMVCNMEIGAASGLEEEWSENAGRPGRQPAIALKPVADDKLS